MGLTAGLVEVFDAEDEVALGGDRPLLGKPKGTPMAQMQMAGGGWGKASAIGMRRGSWSDHFGQFTVCDDG